MTTRGTAYAAAAGRSCCPAMSGAGCISEDSPPVCRTTPAHVVRCVLGTALRLAVYGSVLNLGLSYAGKTEGFWATKV